MIEKPYALKRGGWVSRNSGPVDVVRITKETKMTAKYQEKSWQGHWLQKEWQTKDLSWTARFETEAEAAAAAERAKEAYDNASGAVDEAAAAHKAAVQAREDAWRKALFMMEKGT